MEFRPLIIGNGSRGFNHEQRPEERNLLGQLENGTDQEENVPGVDCTLKLGFPDHETPAQTPQSQPSSSTRSTPQQQVRSNDQMLHGGVANLYGSNMAAMNNIPLPPPPPFSWPPVQQHAHPSNYVPRYGGRVPLYPSPPPPPLMAAAPLESGRTSNAVYPTYNYNIPLPSFANQRYVGHVLRPRGGEEANHPARKCMACNTSSTPLWRNGPGGPKSLCNACGIRFKKEERKSMGIEPQSRQKGGGSRHPEGSSRSS